jgi:hypothetical protein
MTLLKKFAEFWYDFIVGDSWGLAMGVLLILVVAKAIDVLVPAEIAVPFIPIALPIAVVAVLAISLARAER